MSKTDNWKIFDGIGANPQKPIIVDCVPDINGKCVANCVAFICTTNPEYKRNAVKIAALPELLRIVSDFLQWGRDNTSPIDANSPHEILCRAFETLERIGEQL